MKTKQNKPKTKLGSVIANHIALINEATKGTRDASKKSKGE
jgi:hypothetical protein